MKTPQLPYGEGSISKRENGTYVYKKTLHLPNGDKKRVSVYGKTPKECMDNMRFKEKDMNDFVSRQINYTEILTDAMYSWLVTTKRFTVKSQSYKRIETTIKNQIEPYQLGQLRIMQIFPIDIQQHINDLIDVGLSYSTIKKTYDCLNDFYRTYSIQHKIDNPMLSVNVPRRDMIEESKKEIAFFEQDDIEKFVKECGARYKTGNLKYKNGYMLAANIFLGLRIGELLALQWKDIDLEKRVVSVSKTQILTDNPEHKRNKQANKTKLAVQDSTKRGKNRYVPINDKAYELIVQHKENSNFTEDDDFVISTKKGTMNSNKHISETIANIEKNAGTRQQSSNTHLLRHTCASLYFRNGVPIEVICAILGNSREVCETTYIHFVEEQLKEASNKTLQYINF